MYITCGVLHDCSNDNIPLKPGVHTSNKTTEHLCGRRMYIEQYSDDVSKHKEDAQAALAPIISVALDISKLTEFTGRDKPTVIT